MKVRCCRVGQVVRGGEQSGILWSVRSFEGMQLLAAAKLQVHGTWELPCRIQTLLEACQNFEELDFDPGNGKRVWNVLCRAVQTVIQIPEQRTRSLNLRSLGMEEKTDSLEK